MLTSNEYIKCHQWCCHDVTDWQDFTAHVFNFFDLYATDVKIYPGIDRFFEFGFFVFILRSFKVIMLMTHQNWMEKKMDSFISTTSLAISWLENSWQIFLPRPWKMLKFSSSDWSSLVATEILWLIMNAELLFILYSISLIRIYSTLRIMTVSSMHFQGL